MPTISIARKHSLTHAKARAVAEKIARDLKKRFELDYEWDGDAEVSWVMAAPGSLLRAMDGAYVLTGQGDGSTEVVYQLAVDVKIPMIGMIKRKAEKVIVDTALKKGREIKCAPLTVAVLDSGGAEGISSGDQTFISRLLSHVGEFTNSSGFTNSVDPDNQPDI